MLVNKERTFTTWIDAAKLWINYTTSAFIGLQVKNQTKNIDYSCTALVHIGITISEFESELPHYQSLSVVPSLASFHFSVLLELLLSPSFTCNFHQSNSDVNSKLANTIATYKHQLQGMLLLK